MIPDVFCIVKIYTVCWFDNLIYSSFPDHLIFSSELFFRAELRFESDYVVYRRRSRSQSCPFCRDNLKRVNSGDLWVFTDSRDVVDMSTLTKENLRRLFMYIEKLPLIVPESLFDAYDSHIKWMSLPSVHPQSCKFLPSLHSLLSVAQQLQMEFGRLG